ncbi:failed axon connections homolog [Oratosquilla oratoria]|uniref:failed axon connections homolog n=1 Tax=Oratosquilla oratoria TaxID=337810 RepID=UPI003F766E97
MSTVPEHGWHPAASIGQGINWLWREHKLAIATVIIVVSFIKITKILRKKRLRQQWDNAGQDVVVLHTRPRSKVCPGVSPFALKLETYLRMASIKYVLDHEEPMGPKGKYPWITINGEDIADSQLIIERLNGRFQRDLDTSLSQERKAVATAFRIMVDEHLFWSISYFRFVINDGRLFRETLNIPFWNAPLPLIKRKVKKMAWYQGFGRHSHSEMVSIARNDLRALADFLGHSPFLMGEEPTEVDCAVFGCLAQFEWCDVDTPMHAMMQGEFENLKQYCHRMKQRFWPDWDRLCHV